MDALTYRLAQLSGRERILLALLMGVAVPLALAFLLVLPMLEAREAADRAAVEAEALRGWVAERVEALPPEGLNAASVADSPPAIGLSGLEQSLIAAGLRDRVAQLSDREDGGVELRFDPVPFAALAAWLADTTPGWRYRIATFRIARDGPGLSVASFVLEPGE